MWCSYDRFRRVTQIEKHLLSAMNHLFNLIPHPLHGGDSHSRDIHTDTKILACITDHQGIKVRVKAFKGFFCHFDEIDIKRVDLGRMHLQESYPITHVKETGAHIAFYFFVVIVAADTLNFLGTILLSVVISLGTILSAFLLRTKNAESAVKRENRVYSPEKRTIFLYLIPWVIFSLINATLAKNTTLDISQQVSSSFYLVLLVLQLFGVIIGALIGGTIADLVGRRLPLALSLSLYGVSAVLSGLFINIETLAFSYIANGLSWGILFTLYIFVIWGDLANKENCAKVYSIGLVTYYSTEGIGLLTRVSAPIIVTSLVSCLLIFMLIIPIALAPELLPSDFRRKIRMKRHMNAVKRIKQSANQG